jgi:hypothetical protein
MGWRANDATGPLLKALSDDDRPQVRAAAARALGGVAPSGTPFAYSIIPTWDYLPHVKLALETAVTDPDPDVAKAAGDVLQQGAIPSGSGFF